MNCGALELRINQLINYHVFRYSTKSKAYWFVSSAGWWVRVVSCHFESSSGKNVSVSSNTC